MQKGPSCPLCHNSFIAKDNNRRAPLLLICGHTFCEGCLMRLMRETKSGIVCPTCKIETRLPDSENGVRSLWPDYYITGLLVCNQRIFLNQELAKLALTDSIQLPGYGLSRNNADERTGRYCRECCRKPATCKCDHCHFIMCKHCFDRIHSSSNALKIHRALPIEVETSASPEEQPSTCQVHEGRVLEYFCEDDDVTICSRCVIIGGHKNHSIVSMEEKNKALMIEMEPAVGLANKVVKNVKKADKTLCKMVPDIKKETADVIAQIKEHFQFLHGILQSREKHLIEEVYETFKEGIRPLSDVRTTMQDEVTQLEKAIKTAKKILSGPGDVAHNAKDVLMQLHQAKHIPCIVVPTEPAPDEKICFQPGDSLSTDISGYGNITGTYPLRMSWYSLSEKPDDVTLDDTDPDTPSESASLSSVPDMSESEESISKDESELSDNSVKQQMSAKVSRKTAKSKVKGKNDLVYVTHIKNPSYFVIQRKDDESQLKKMAKNLNTWANGVSSSKDIPTDVQPGDNLTARYTCDNMWYRARVRQVLKGDTNTKMRVEVLYIDYGNCEVVPIERTRKMPSKFTQIPEFSVECCLYDITPTSESGWTVEAIQTMAKMITDRCLHMAVINEVNNILHVDLSKPPLNDTKDDVPISIRDSLVFLELAYFISPDSGNIVGMPPPKRQYVKPEMHQKSDDYDCIVTCCGEPTSFYVQEVGEESVFFASLMQNLQVTYGVDNGDIWTIYCPKKGMVCCCQYSGDNLWYRSVVLDLPGQKLVDVLYVDFGTTERVPYWRLRKLLDEFLVLPVQATKCQLADVEPSGSDMEWSSESKRWWSDRVTMKTFRIKIEDTADEIYTVTLTDGQYKSGSTVNGELVAIGYANSTGKCSTSMPKEYFRPPLLSSEDSSTETSSKSSKRSSRKTRSTLSTSSMSSESDTPVSTPSSTPRKKMNRELAQKKSMQDNSKHKTSNGTAGQKSKDNFVLSLDIEKASKSKVSYTQPSPAKSQTGSESGDPESPAMVEVQISQYTSPSDFYVQLVPAGREELDQMMAKLNEQYQNNEPQWVSWDVGSFCAARYPDDNRWYRGRITQVLHKNVIQVLMVDYGYTASVNSSDLRPLHNQFVKQKCYACKCHLSDITPAGDSKKWSSTACEFMMDEIGDKRMYIQKKGEVQDQSQPIDLLIEENIPESALEPSRKSYYSLTDRLWEKGLGIPVRRQFFKQDAGVKQTKDYPVLHYRSPEMPLDSSLLVMPVYVGHSGIIYVQDVKQADQLTKMSERIMQMFSESEPHNRKEVKWQESQACIALFHLDKLWHRAKILKLENHRVKVQFVDFGNCEFVGYDNIRADVIDFIDIPQLCLECDLYNVIPKTESGKWQRGVLNYIHKTIVNKNCVMEIMEKSLDEPLTVVLMLPDNSDLGHLLCDNGMAVRPDNINEIIENSQKIEDILKKKNPYKSAPIAPPGDYFNVLVTHVEVPDVVYFQHTRNDEFEQNERTDDINSQLSQLEQMAVDLNESGPMATPLPRPRKGLACCAQYGFDKCWYRAVVVDFKDRTNEVLVLYVDYGTSEQVPIDRVRALPPRFSRLPAQATRLCLTSVQLPSGETTWSRNSLIEMLTTVGNKELICCLQKKQPAEGDLFIAGTTEWGSLQLAYRNLLSEGVIQIPEESGLYEDATTMGLTDSQSLNTADVVIEEVEISSTDENVDDSEKQDDVIIEEVSE